MKTLSKQLIYRAEDLYDEARPEFNCYQPTETGSWWIIDCWPCTVTGQFHPDCDAAPVPINVNGIGEAVAVAPGY